MFAYPVAFYVTARLNRRINTDCVQDNAVFCVGKLQEWDNTNFLVDLAGQYANCDNLGTTGPIRVDRKTPAGQTITGFVDNMDGSRTDVDSVNGYLRSLVDRWTAARTYDGMVTRF